MLKEDFIPVWEAVAPVRTVTFDLGEGKKIKGSVSGEIAIYFCDTRGKVFDILPALQSPAATLNAMKKAKQLHAKLMKISIYNTEGRIDISKPNYSRQEEAVLNFHKNRMKEIAARKYDALLKAGTDILKNPEKVPAAVIFPKSAEGESKRDNYINAATDDATRDLRMMALSKSGPRPTLGQRTYTENALTVVEPGGRGYYLWQIGQAMHGTYPMGYFPESDGIPILTFTGLMTPDEWKKILFG